MIYYCLNILNFFNRLTSSNITSKGASILFKTLKECNSEVEYISLEESQINDDCMEDLGEFIQSDSFLKNISIGNSYGQDTIISDKGIEILTPYLIGNTVLKEIGIFGPNDITTKSFPLLNEIALKSCLNNFYIDEPNLSEDEFNNFNQIFNIPLDQREIPIFSLSKSAKKSSQSEEF